MTTSLDSLEDAATQLLGAIRAATNAQREASQRLELAVSEAAQVQGRQLAAALAHDAADLFGERIGEMQDEANRLLAVDAGVRAERGMAYRRTVWMWGTLTVCLFAVLTWGWVNKLYAEAERPAHACVNELLSN